MTPVWDTVSDVVADAEGICWDGCHKIYVLLDDGEVATMTGFGYDVLPVTDADDAVETIMGWFDKSCSLRFVSSIRSVGDDEDRNAGFEHLIPQGFDWEERAHDRTIEATSENVECPTCNDFRQVFASRDVERPELDRWYACPDCTTPENVEEPIGCVWCKGRTLLDHDCRNFAHLEPENVEGPDLPCEHEHTVTETDNWGKDYCVCEDCEREVEPEDTRSFYRDPDTGRITW